MKKNWLKWALCLVLAVGMLTCVASAAIAQEDVAADASVATITVSSDGKLTVAANGTADKQYVLIQVKTDLKADTAAALLTAAKAATTQPYDLNADAILYIDQDAAAAGGKVTFSNFQPKAVANSLFILGGETEPQIIGAMIARGVTVKGKVQSYNQKNPVTVTLYEVGTTTEVASTTIEGQSTTTGNAATQDFEIPAVPAGTYDLKVTKAGHLSYTVTNVVVSDTDLDLGASSKDYKVMEMLCGDMNGDNKCIIQDLGVFRADFGKAAAAASNPLTDCNGDGNRTIKDLSAFRLAFGKNAPTVAY